MEAPAAKEDQVIDDINKCQVGMQVVLTGDLDDPWTELRAGNKGIINRIEPRDRFGMKDMLHCSWDNGAVLGVFLDDPIELTQVPE